MVNSWTSLLDRSISDLHHLKLARLPSVISDLQSPLNNTQNSDYLRGCLVKSDDYDNLSKKYKTLKEYKLAKLTPIELVAVNHHLTINASYYDLSFHPISSDKDCKLYKNSKAIKCYSCDSCRAGVAQYMKAEWRVVAIFKVILFVVLSIIYFVGYCARQNAARNQSNEMDLVFTRIFARPGN